MCLIHFRGTFSHCITYLNGTYNYKRGPVIGMSYGLVIWDLPLIKRSARNEIFSVVICVVLGLIIGEINVHFSSLVFLFFRGNNYLYGIPAHCSPIILDSMSTIIMCNRSMLPMDTYGRRMAHPGDA